MKRAYDDTTNTATNSDDNNDSTGAPAKSKAPRHKKPKMKWGLRRGPITGSKGILVTCAVSSEQRCANEISSFLELVSQSLLPQEQEQSTPTQTSANEGKETEAKTKKKMTLQEMLDLEKAEMEEEPEAKTSAFIPMYSGVNGVIFIKMTHETLSPTALVEATSERVMHPQAGDVHLRYTIRLVPLEKTCQVSVDDIASTLRPLLEKGDLLPKDAGKRYRFEYKARNNSSVSRTAVFPAVMGVMPQGNIVDLKRSDVVVIIEIFKTTCGVAVTDKFDTLGKFNLRAIAESNTAESDKKN